MTGHTIYISSDYCGAEKALLYDVVTVLYLDTDISGDWVPKRNAIRTRYLSDGRRMNFKSLNDKKRQAALVPFLDAANSIGGVAISVAIRKTLKSLYADRELLARCINEKGFDPGWKLDAFERAARITHLVGLLAGGLSWPNQNIYWISDQDDMFANSRRSLDVKKLLESLTSHYVSHPLGNLGLGTTAIDEGDRHDEDLNGVTDLMCGAVAEVTSAVARKCGGHIPAALSLPCNIDLSPKSDLIFSWICDQSYNLRRAVVVIDQAITKGLSVFKFDMQS